MKMFVILRKAGLLFGADEMEMDNPGEFVRGMRDRGVDVEFASREDVEAAKRTIEPRNNLNPAVVYPTYAIDENQDEDTMNDLANQSAGERTEARFRDVPQGFRNVFHEWQKDESERELKRIPPVIYKRGIAYGADRVMISIPEKLCAKLGWKHGTRLGVAIGGDSKTTLKLAVYPSPEFEVKRSKGALTITFETPMSLFDDLPQGVRKVREYVADLDTLTFGVPYLAPAPEPIRVVDPDQTEQPL